MSAENRNYEATIVLNLQGEESIDHKISTIEREMLEEGAKLEKIDRMGKRDFAYNARKKKSGYYVSYAFSAPPDTIDRLKSKFRIHPDIYMQAYMRIS